MLFVRGKDYGDVFPNNIKSAFMWGILCCVWSKSNSNDLRYPAH